MMTVPWSVYSYRTKESHKSRQFSSIVVEIPSSWVTANRVSRCCRMAVLVFQLLEVMGVLKHPKRFQVITPLGQDRGGNEWLLGWLRMAQGNLALGLPPPGPTKTTVWINQPYGTLIVNVPTPYDTVFTDKLFHLLICIFLWKLNLIYIFQILIQRYFFRSQI